MNRRWNLLAWTILVAVFLGMSIYLILNPTRTGVVPNYRMAATNWWACLKIYGEGTHGFLYFPQFIILFTPFHLIWPQVLGEIVWRLAGFSLFIGALLRLRWILERGVSRPDLVFLSLVLMAVPASLASINNGQTNLPLAACLVLSALALRKEKWWVAALLLVTCVILKPIALAPFLLALAVFPRIRKPLLVSLIVFGVIGILHLDLGYALDRWQACLLKIFRSYRPENLRVSDLFGMLDKAGIAVPILLESVTRALACLSALGFVFWKYRQGGSQNGSWGLWVATVLVFTIFNPRAETNSYVLASPLLAFVAADHLLRPGGNRSAGWILALACLGLMCDGMGRTIYLATDVWFKPLIVLVVSPLLFRVPDGWKSKI